MSMNAVTINTTSLPNSVSGEWDPTAPGKITRAGVRTWLSPRGHPTSA